MFKGGWHGIGAISSRHEVDHTAIVKSRPGGGGCLLSVHPIDPLVKLSLLRLVPLLLALHPADAIRGGENASEHGLAPIGRTVCRAEDESGVTVEVWPGKGA